ncbi:nSTAND1 domain-containing NTPase [Amycolatopsis pigmentata]|uniref:HTH cro/C1-type domain-containing protein n=1 Tax=Amycolatopsis pigmentata TaxID=450801 RepID=A0ABW5FPX9_9PSEU
MPRPERPLDADGDVLQRLAAGLRRLRERAGSPGYRELARRAHYSATTLSNAAAGRKLPSLAVMLAYVRACGGDPVEWEARWRAVATELAPMELETPEQDLRAPYVGLGTFQPEDADRFFGRSRLVAELRDQLTQRRFVAVFGPSGSGKSSLLRAGLVPALAGGDHHGRPVVLCTPGEHPLEEGAAQLARLMGIPASAVLADLRADPHHLHLAIRQALADRPGDVELLIVVDQFEEVFTLCQDIGERAQFITALLGAARASTSRARIVLGIRADFYGRCAEHPDLIEALRDGQTLVGAMAADQLREAIVQPAVRAGLTVENALVATIVAEMVGRPGALPLMSHALVETWRRRRGTTLSLAGYQTAGGVEGALAQSAERVYQALNRDQRSLAREMFLRLTAPGEGTEDTRRRVRRGELDRIHPGDDGAGSDFGVVLDMLVRARLLTVGEETVEITHEALIRSWPRLRGWLAEDRDGLRLHRQLTEAARTWETLDRDPGALYRGLQLALTREWDERRRARLTASEREFLDAGIDQQTREYRSSRRRTHRVLATLACLALAVSVAITAGVVAIQRGHAAADQQRTALSRALAARSTALAASQPEASMRLAVEAFDQAPTPEARGALLTAQTQPFQARLYGSPSDTWLSVRYSPDGTILAAGSTNGDIKLWDTRTHTPLPGPSRANAAIRALAFSPDSHTLVTATTSDPATLRFWDVTSGEETFSRTHHGKGIMALTFSPDGRTLAVAGEGAALWDVASHREIATLTPDAPGVWGASFSPDGRTLATGDSTGTITLWDVPSHQKRLAWTGRPLIRQAAFSPDGLTLATASYDGAVQLWDPATGHEDATLTGSSATMAVAFSPDGRTLAATGDETALWEIATRQARAIWSGHRSTIADVAFSPDGRQLATAGEDSTVAVWNTTGTGNTSGSVLSTAPAAPVLGISLTPGSDIATTATRDGTVDRWNTKSGGTIGTWVTGIGALRTLTFSRDGQALAAISRDGHLALWTAERGWETPAWLPDAYLVAGVAFSADGHTLATVEQGSVVSYTSVTLWDLVHGRKIATWPSTGRLPGDIAFSPDGHSLATTGDGAAKLWDLSGHQTNSHPIGYHDTFTALAFSPDGHTLALAAADGTIILRDGTTGAETTTLTSRSTPLDRIAFSPDGTTLAAGGRDGTVYLWDPASKTEIATLAGHGGSVTALAFSPGSDVLATAGDDGTTRLWNLDTTMVAGRLCTTTSGTISPEQWAQLIPELPYRTHCP